MATNASIKTPQPQPLMRQRPRSKASQEDDDELEQLHRPWPQSTTHAGGTHDGGLMGKRKGVLAHMEKVGGASSHDMFCFPKVLLNSCPNTFFPKCVGYSGG